MEKKEYTQEEKDAYRKMRQDKFNQAYREARDEIVKDAEFRMEEVKSKNEEQAILYTFHFAKDASSKVDSNGTKIVFGEGIRLLDILTKGRQSFLNVLNEHFNKDGETKYHCGFFKKYREDGSGINDWNIYVSWAPLKPRTEKKNPPKKVVSNEKKFSPKDTKVENVKTETKQKTGYNPVIRPPFAKKNKNTKPVEKKGEVKKTEIKKSSPDSWAGKVASTA
jgi:hypothetical protein